LFNIFLSLFNLFCLKRRFPPLCSSSLSIPGAWIQLDIPVSRSLNCVCPCGQTVSAHPYRIVDHAALVHGCTGVAEHRDVRERPPLQTLCICMLYFLIVI